MASMLATALVWGGWLAFDSWRTLGTFDVSPDLRVKVRRDLVCDVNCILRYRAERGGRTLVDDAIVGYAPTTEGLTFVNVAPPSSGLLAIVEVSAPDVVLVLEDVRDDATWPAEASDRDDELGRSLLQRLRQHRPESTVLSVDVPGNRRTKISP